MMTSTVRRQTTGVGTLLFLILFGAVFIGAGVFAMRQTTVDPSWIRTTGVVIDVANRSGDSSTTYAPVVEYRVDDTAYRVTSGVSSSAYPTVGAVQEVAYSPSEPAQGKVVEGAGTQALLWLFPIIGAAVMLFGSISFIRSVRRSSRIRQLTHTGRKLQGVLVDLQGGGSDSARSYRIVVAATDESGAVQHYVSDPLSDAAGLAMADFQHKPISIDVYVDPAGSGEYYVDISDIPSLTPERIGELLKSAAAANTFKSVAGGQQPTRE